MGYAHEKQGNQKLGNRWGGFWVPVNQYRLFDLEVDDGVLGFLFSSNLELLTSLHDLKGASLALSALKTENDLLSGLGLLVEDRLGLTSITSLLAVITALTLSVQTGGTSLVLGNLVEGVLTALREIAQSATGLGNVHHFDYTSWHRSNTEGLSVSFHLSFFWPRFSLVIQSHRLVSPIILRLSPYPYILHHSSTSGSMTLSIQPLQNWPIKNYLSFVSFVSSFRIFNV